MNIDTQLISDVFRQAADQSRDAILISDRNNKIVYVNKVFTELTGYSAAEVIGESPNILKSGIQTEEFYQQLWDSILNEGQWKGELWNRRKDGTLIFEQQHIIAINNGGSKPESFISIFSDRTKALKEAQQKKFVEHYDPKTKLHNKKRLLAYLHKLIEQQSTPFNYLSVNFKDLKDINSAYGPKFGDEFLAMIGQRLNNLGDQTYFIGRVSGGSFALLTPYHNNQTKREQSLLKIVEILQRPMMVSDIKIFPQVEVGIIENAQASLQPEELVMFTDLSLYRNDSVLRKDFYHINCLEKETIKREFKLSQDIQLALTNDEFEMYYQPQHHSVTGKILAAEALIRWHSQDGFVSPAEFLPVAEKYNLVGKLDEYVIDKVFADIKMFKNTLKAVPKISINISDQLISIEKIQHLMRKHDVSTEEFELEITEKLIANNSDELNEYLAQLRQLGIHTSIDDFGTGYSSLARLRSLKVDKLKVDKSFIDNVLDNVQDREILSSIIAIGKALKMTVVAEGVETAAQRKFLCELGCDVIQGYYFSKPEPKSALVEKLRQEDAVPKLLQKFRFVTQAAWCNSFSTRVFSPIKKRA